jgi:hypothetical protein
MRPSLTGYSTFRYFSGGIAGVRSSHSWNIGLGNSFIGGGTLGCNWQPVGSPSVFGIEGDAGYMKLEGSAFDPLINSTLPVTAVRGSPDVLGTAKISGDGYGMITGRLGYAWNAYTFIYINRRGLAINDSVGDTSEKLTEAPGPAWCVKGIAPKSDTQLV